MPGKTLIPCAIPSIKAERMRQGFLLRWVLDEMKSIMEVIRKPIGIAFIFRFFVKSFSAKPTIAVMQEAIKINATVSRFSLSLLVFFLTINRSVEKMRLVILFLKTRHKEARVAT